MRRNCNKQEKKALFSQTFSIQTRFMKKYLILFSALIFSIFTFAQDSLQNKFFEGLFEYKVEIAGVEKILLEENQPNTQMAMRVKDNNYVVNLIGGMYPKTFMFIADSNFEYSIDVANKRAYRTSAYSTYSPMSKRPPVKPTGKKEVIMGIECEMYEHHTDSTLSQFWVSDKYKVDLSLFAKKKRAQANFLVPGLGGRIPLKMVKREKTITSTTTVTKIKPMSLRSEQFTIPIDFEVKQRDLRW